MHCIESLSHATEGGVHLAFAAVESTPIVLYQPICSLRGCIPLRPLCAVCLESYLINVAHQLTVQFVAMNPTVRTEPVFTPMMSPDLRHGYLEMSPTNISSYLWVVSV